MKTTSVRQSAQSAVQTHTLRAAHQEQAEQPSQPGTPVQLQRAERLGHDFARTSVTTLDRHFRDAGRPLPGPLRTMMERAFDADFSDVRVHVGPEAQAMGAAAFTRGSDIHFSPTGFRPGTSAGQALIRHELTHVLQQRAGQVPLPRPGDWMINEDSRLEEQADSIARGGIDSVQHSNSSARIVGVSQGSAGSPAAFSGAGLPIQMAKTYYGKIGDKTYYYDPDTGQYYDSDSEGANVVEAPESEYEVGAGDFSAALGRHRDNPKVLRKVTTFESESDVMKRPGARSNVKALKKSGAVVQFNVDATKVGDERSAVPGKIPMSPRPVRRVRFEHPHTGAGSGSISGGVYKQESKLVGTDRDPKKRMQQESYRQFAETNRDLVSGFLSAAPQKGAEVDLTYKRGSANPEAKPHLPYADWEVEKSAADKGLKMTSMRPYAPPKGYTHVQTRNARAKTVSNDTSATLTYQGNADPAHNPVQSMFQHNPMQGLAPQRALPEQPQQAGQNLPEHQLFPPAGADDWHKKLRDAMMKK